jgi:hypothetical protein
VGALTVWGADAERVCVPEAYAVEVPAFCNVLIVRTT